MPDDKEDRLVRAASTTRVCGECGGLFGEVLSKYAQECGCSGSSPKAPRWPRYDFNTAIDLCRGCTTTVIPSGCRWYFFFCPPCLGRVRAENQRVAGTTYIPIGRHSLHHDISWSGGGPPPGHVAEQVKVFSSRVDELGRIHRRRVRAVIASAGEISLPTLTFLERARELYRRDESIDELATAFGTRRAR